MYRCINDKGNLIRENNQLTCQACNSHYDIYNDIPLFCRPLHGVEFKQKLIYEQISITLTPIDILIYPTLLTLFTRKKYMDKLVVLDDMKILDIGTQDGLHLRYLKYKYPNIKDENMYGIDITMSGLLVGKQNNSEINYSQANIYSLPFGDACFDIVIINGVLEHLDKPMDALKEISRILKSNGQFTSFMVVKDYGLSFHWITNDLLKIKKIINESTTAIGHDYDTVIKPLAEYKRCFVRNKLHVIEDERTTVLIEPLIDYIIVKLTPMILNFKQYCLSKLIKSRPIYFKRDRDQINTGDNFVPINLTRVKMLINYIFKATYMITGLERIFFSRFGGINYINYGVKSDVGNDNIII